jgi:hypothetical protein
MPLSVAREATGRRFRSGNRGSGVGGVDSADLVLLQVVLLQQFLLTFCLLPSGVEGG